MKTLEVPQTADEVHDRSPRQGRTPVPSMLDFSGQGANRRMGPIVLLPTLLRDLRGEVFPTSRARGIFGNQDMVDRTGAAGERFPPIGDGLRNEGGK